jgi:hypothetical protein
MDNANEARSVRLTPRFDGTPKSFQVWWIRFMAFATVGKFLQALKNDADILSPLIVILVTMFQDLCILNRYISLASLEPYLSLILINHSSQCNHSQYRCLQQYRYCSVVRGVSSSLSRCFLLFSFSHSFSLFLTIHHGDFFRKFSLFSRWQECLGDRRLPRNRRNDRERFFSSGSECSLDQPRRKRLPRCRRFHHSRHAPQMSLRHEQFIHARGMRKTRGIRRPSL